MTSVEHRMSLHRAQELPAMVDVVTAAAVLGIGRTAAYELIRTDAWPTPVLRLGKLIRIPTASLLALIQPPRSG
jgi:predicted DNA-binding transcriptional regulator AlpA